MRQGVDVGWVKAASAAAAPPARPGEATLVDASWTHPAPSRGWSNGQESLSRDLYSVPLTPTLYWRGRERPREPSDLKASAQAVIAIDVTGSVRLFCNAVVDPARDNYTESFGFFRLRIVCAGD